MNMIVNVITTIISIVIKFLDFEKINGLTEMNKKDDLNVSIE